MCSARYIPIYIYIYIAARCTTRLKIIYSVQLALHSGCVGRPRSVLSAAFYEVFLPNRHTVLALTVPVEASHASIDREVVQKKLEADITLPTFSK